MGYAPLLALLEPARAQGYLRLAVIGIPCHIYALRALERDLGFERLYVIGTPCLDNSTTDIEPLETLWAIGDVRAAGHRMLHGAAIVKAREVRVAQLGVIADEPPPRHAAIRGELWLDTTPRSKRRAARNRLC